MVTHATPIAFKMSTTRRRSSTIRSQLLPSMADEAWGPDLEAEVGRYRRVLVGAPEFVEGDEVVVFLEGRPPLLPSVFGLSQGVYRVTRDAAARVMVMPPRMAASDGRVVRGDPARVPLSMDAFAREVTAALERAR